MTRALNYTPKAIESLRSHPCPDAPGTREGLDYLIGKLEAAEVFVLPDAGELLDRSKPRPELPSAALKPPFPVVALEYSVAARPWDDSEYSSAPASRRVALAWEWTDDLPPILRSVSPRISGHGVVVASIVYYDRDSHWLPIAGAAFLSYEDAQCSAPAVLPRYLDAMLKNRRVSKAAIASGLSAILLPIMPEAVGQAHLEGRASQFMDHISADLMDEVCAYMDLCHILLCRNVRAERQGAPAALNKARNKKSKPPLKDFHVLTIDGHEAGDGSGHGSLRAGPRSHLRRGHIRRLSSDRVTWVNATMVNGQGGFIDKQYSVRAGK